MTAILYIGTPPIDAAYTGQVDGGALASSHSLSLAIGTANASRVVVVALITAAGASSSVSSATIGGISATIGTHYNKSHSTGEYGIQYIWAAVPTGTSATVAITLSASALVIMHGWALTGNPTVAVVAQNANVSASTAVSDPSLSVSTTVATKIGGVTIGTVSAFHSTGTTVTLSAGVSQDANTNQWTVGGNRVSGHIENTSTEENRTITASRNASGYLNQCWSIAAISFR